MKSLLYILIAFALSAFYSCGKQQADSETNQNDEVSKTDKNLTFRFFIMCTNQKIIFMMLTEKYRLTKW